MTTPAQELIADHYSGPSSGFLNVAIEWLTQYALTRDLNDDECLREAAFDDGLPEDEVAAALEYVRGEKPAIRK